MDSIWLQVDNSEQTNTFPYMGIFTCAPEIVASKIPRPTTPFLNCNKKFPLTSNKNDFVFSKTSSINQSQSDPDDSIHFRPLPPYVSVF